MTEDTQCFACSDLQGIKTYAKKDGDDWILNGSKVGVGGRAGEGVGVLNGPEKQEGKYCQQELIHFQHFKCATFVL